MPHRVDVGLVNGYVERVTMNVEAGGDTGALFVAENAIPKDLYHTDWVADHTMKWIDSMDNEDDWFCWMSFPDPHHPYDPPSSENHRVNSRDIDELETPDKIREINAKIHIFNALIDEAIGNVMAHLEAKGWLEDTDIIFTPDHSGMDGDNGLLLIGPAMVDSITRCTMIWKPAAHRQVPTADVHSPVGVLDIPATICDIAGVDVPEWLEGRPLPKDEAEAAQQGRDHVFTQYESYTTDCAIVMNTVSKDGWTRTLYDRTRTYDGTEDELYHTEEDPRQRVNLWNDPDQQGRIAELTELIYEDLLNRPQPHPKPEVGASI